MACGLAALWLTHGQTVYAQVAPSPVATPIRLSGRVVRPSAAGTEPVAGLMVTLHRVGSDTAGPVDSMRTSGKGAYAFTFRPRGASDAVYFAAASYGGVAYFTAPFRSNNAPSEDDAEITVFDTTSRPVPIDVRGHHLVVGTANPDGVRTITEVFDLSNDSSVTRVAVGNAPSGAVWSSRLPTGAQNPAVSQGDIPRGAVTFAEGRVNVFAPMGPGVKQLVMTYTVAGDAFPLALAIANPTSVFEVLLEEPTAKVSGLEFRDVGMVSASGRRFHRFLSTNVAANTIAKIDVPTTDRPLSTWYMAILTLLIGGAMTGALVYALKRR